jgi:hypothetical protein
MSAPKQLVKQQKLARKRQRKLQSRLKKEKKRGYLREGWFSSAEPSGPILHFGDSGGLKMSDLLKEFVEPYHHEAHDADAYRRLLSLGLLAWNAALQPEAEQQEMVDDVIGKGMHGESEEVQAFVREIVNQLIARKLHHFAQYRRPILDFVLQETDDGLHLAVISAVV